MYASMIIPLNWLLGYDSWPSKDQWEQYAMQA